ncbi:MULTISPECIES: DEAD/DEAH box helicase [unclassified Micromonospora]|uniref:DEAD/DEAH box helicase n=1 Tax=unclassified Micromonospora TaxID=2617518 RepID=UPI00249C8E0B|nr:MULTISPECIES: DEAD/DEAH box helicase [unclassified Micromonospora]WFE51673.1 DEAD/DEAH box helicase [Micromonospora sp. WMMD1155]WFF01599.1 DEAD/DEAH box helicase [Micromonospora sp. WMMD964]
MSELTQDLMDGQELAPTAPVRPEAPTFAALGARAETVEALAAAGITRAFAIQEYAIPIALRGVDLIGQAPTGTGKTLGFGVPLLDRVFAPGEGGDGVPQALVVVPTRELGIQVAKDLAAAGRTRGVRVLPIYGGVAYEPQIDALRKGVEILVGTPGRLMDLQKQKHLRLDRVHALVLDEADRMLDLGFLDDVEKILAMLPEDRQTMLFSATMPDPIVTLSRRFLRQPMTIHAGHTAETGPSPQTQQLVYRTHSMNKVEVVARILQAEGRGLTMIFTRTKRAADRVAEDLDFRGFAVAAVHGDLGQGARERALRAFRAGKIDILVATDVAARGLDVTGVTHVINYDCPEDQDTYTHRIGRTGRAGATGVAVTFVDWDDMPRWRIIDKTLGLEMPEPPETYHTSPHLYTDLHISTEVSGTLPTAERTRAGLAAEIEEDLGGTTRSRRGDGGGRGSRRGEGRGERRGRGDSRRGRSDADTATTAEAPAGDAADEGTRTPRRRRRRRAGEVVAGEATTVIAAEPGATEPAAASDGEPSKPRRRRRRRGGGSGAGTPAEATAD